MQPAIYNVQTAPKEYGDCSKAPLPEPRKTSREQGWAIPLRGRVSYVLQLAAAYAARSTAAASLARASAAAWFVGVSRLYTEHRHLKLDSKRQLADVCEK